MALLFAHPLPQFRPSPPSTPLPHPGGRPGRNRVSWQGRSWPQQSHSMEDEYRRNLREREEARDEAERQLRDVQNQLRQERARSKLREEAQEREKTSWGSQEEAFKKRIAQLEWNTEMYAVATRENEAKDRELKEWKEAFDELEKSATRPCARLISVSATRSRRKATRCKISSAKCWKKTRSCKTGARDAGGATAAETNGGSRGRQGHFQERNKLYKEFFDFVASTTASTTRATRSGVSPATRSNV